MGNWASPINVYQAKFFPADLGDSQKTQIRESFKQCTTDARFTVRSWTLCLPKDLTIEETAWFTTWKGKQNTAVIETPWTASIMEHRLNQASNRGIKEAYFKEGYLAQIREMHSTLSKPIILVPKLDDVSPSRCERQGENIVVGIELRFSVTNTGLKAARVWKVACGLEAEHLERKVVTKTSFPGFFKNRRRFYTDRTILATQSQDEHVTIGVILRPRDPFDIQLYEILKDMRAHARAISEDHNPEPTLFVLGDHINFDKLIWQVRGQLEKDGIAIPS